MHHSQGAGGSSPPLSKSNGHQSPGELHSPARREFACVTKIECCNEDHGITKGDTNHGQGHDDGPILQVQPTRHLHCFSFSPADRRVFSATNSKTLLNTDGTLTKASSLPGKPHAHVGLCPLSHSDALTGRILANLRLPSPTPLSMCVVCTWG